MMSKQYIQSLSCCLHIGNKLDDKINKSTLQVFLKSICLNKHSKNLMKQVVEKQSHCHMMRKLMNSNKSYMNINNFGMFQKLHHHKIPVSMHMKVLTLD